MSRIGNKPIPIPAGIKVDIKGSHVKITGPKGSLEREISPVVGLEQKDKLLELSTPDKSKKSMALKGLTRTLVHNMVVGVAEGFRRKLMIEGVGYKADAAGSAITLNVGFSSPVVFQLPAGVKAEVDKSNTITLEAIDKDLLGLTAARLRAVKKPEPYKGKGIRYEREHIVRKVGKSGGKK